MTVNDIFTVCHMSIIFDIKSGQMMHHFTDISSNLPVMLNSQQYAICIQLMHQYTSQLKDYFPSTICMSGHFVHDSSAIYVTRLDSVYLVNLQTTNTYIDIVGETATFRDEKTDMPVEIDDFPDEEYAKFSADIIGMILQGYDFSKQGYDRITMFGNIKNMDDNKILYSYDKALLVCPTLDFVSIIFNSIQRRDYNNDH